MSVAFDANILRSEKLHDLKDWVAIVTGGGTGLGYITAVTLALHGARVYIQGRRTDVLNEAVTKFEKDTGLKDRIIPFKCDITKQDQIKEFIDFFTAREKYLNVLINNAGIGGVKNRAVSLPPGSSAEEFSKALLETTENVWDDILHINIKSVYYLTASFVPLLVKAKENFSTAGSVINISSMSGITKQSQGGQFPYNVAKAGLISLSEQLAYELRRQDIGIRVNNIAPGYFSSEMTPSSLFSGTPAQIYEKWGIPAGRQGNCKDYAQTILFLVSNEYTNGSTIVVDGEWLLENS